MWDADDGLPVEREPLHDRFTPPDEPPTVVPCCPHCGREVTGLDVGDNDYVDACRDHGIVEGQTVNVPVEIYEAGQDAVLGYYVGCR